ncbi:MAG: hypothetical protein J6P05_02420 [Lachnospiraceae bacterium]|nr:hypothetical protein [Lachnospiraceae bacterium]
MAILDEQNSVLCVANAYEKKYYFNPIYGRLPENIQNEIKAMCVLFTEEVGGVLSLYFDEEGELILRTESDEEDITYDEIGAGLLIGRMRREKAELFKGLELFHKVIFECV